MNEGNKYLDCAERGLTPALKAGQVTEIALGLCFALDSLSIGL